MEKNERIITSAFFIILLITGLIVFDDYGLSYDENPQRDLGVYYYNYIFKGDNTLMGEMIKIYGPFFEVSLIILEKAMGLTDSRDIFLMRHLVTFGFFYISLIFFYLLLKDLFKDWRWALIGCIMLVLSPRIFANSFYNDKDLAFMSGFIIATYTMNNYLKKQDVKNALIHGLITGILIDIRIIGLLIPMTTLIFFTLKFFTEKNQKEINLKFRLGKYEINSSINQQITSIIIYSIAVIGFTILFWPTLWEGPVYYFIQSFKEMSQFPHWDNTVFYQGNDYKAGELPWHYIPVWVFITTPILYSALFIIGLSSIITKLLVDKKMNNEIIHAFLFFSPIIIVTILGSVLYNGWRHVYFIYPSMILIAVFGLKSLSKLIKGKIKIEMFEKKHLIPINNLILGMILIISFSTTILTMIQIHPYECVYFNELLNNDMQSVKEQFPLDYWGLTVKEALEYIINNDERENVIVYTFGMDTLKILPKEQRDKITFAAFDVIGLKTLSIKANYLVNNYDHVIEDYSYGTQVYKKMIGNAAIMEVRTIPEGTLMEWDISELGGLQ